MPITYETKWDSLRIWRRECLKAFPQHLHNYIEIMYLKSGSVKYYINFEEYDLSAGDIVFVFPEAIHAHEASEPDTENRIIILPIDIPFMKDIFQNMIPACPVLKGAVTEELDDLFEAALKASMVQSAHSQLVALGYAQIFVGKLLDMMELQDAKSRPDSLEKRLIEYCAAHYCEDITLSSVASQFGYSPAYLSHVFAQKFKVGFVKFLNTLRIEEAKKMLRGNDAITEIAYACGYTGIRNFNRVFKETVGKTPKEYRESKKK